MNKNSTTSQISSVPLDILYQDDGILVLQTFAGDFDKFATGSSYGDFNLALHVNDVPQTVLLRRANLLAALQAYHADIDRIHWLNQVHGDTVVDVDMVKSYQLQAADALMSTQANTALAIMTADCVPVAIFDAKAQTSQPIACVHAGWQGLVKGMIKQTIKALPAMHKPKALIGACISQRAYQIDKSLADKIITQVCTSRLVAYDKASLARQIIADDTDDKVRIDIGKLARLQLEHLGVQVLSDTIACSYQDGKYYSYRAQTHAGQRATGRMAMLIVRLG